MQDIFPKQVIDFLLIFLCVLIVFRRDLTIADIIKDAGFV